MSDIDIIVTDFVSQKSYVETAPYFRKIASDYIKSILKVNSEQVLIAESHHRAHAYSALYTSGFKALQFL